MNQQNFFLSDQLKGDLGNFFHSTSVFWKSKENELNTEAKKLVFLLKQCPEASNQPQIKQICANFLAGIAQIPQNQDILRELGLLEEIIPLLEHQNESMAIPAYSAYAELLSNNPQNQAKLFQVKDFVEKIISACSSPNDVIKEISLRILMHYSMNAELQQSLVKKSNFWENVIKTIPPAASKTNTLALGYAIAIITNLSKEKNSIITNGMVVKNPPIILQVLADYLSSPVLSLRESAMQSIQYLIENNIRWRNAVISGVGNAKGIFDVVISQLQSNNANIVRRILKILLSISQSFEAESNEFDRNNMIDVNEAKAKDVNFEDPEITNQKTITAIQTFFAYKKHILSLLFKLFPSKGNQNNENLISYLPSVLKLLSVLSSSPELMHTFRELDGLNVYATALLFYISMPNARPEITANIAYTLNNLLYDEANLNSFLEKDGLKNLISAISDPNSSEEVITEVTFLLANLCVGFDEVRAYILQSKPAIQKISQIVAQNNYSKLRERCLRVMMNLTLSITSIEDAKLMLDSNSISLVSNIITQTPLQCFLTRDPNASKAYPLYNLALKFFTNLTAIQSIQPHVLRSFHGVEYFINLLKTLSPSSVNTAEIEHWIEIPLNLLKILSNLTMKGRIRKYIHETQGILPLINSFSTIPLLAEQLEILSSNLKFPYEKSYADDDDDAEVSEKSLPQIVHLPEDEDEEEEEEEEGGDENEVQRSERRKAIEEELRIAKEKLEMEMKQHEEEERLLREEEEKKKKQHEAEMKALAERNRQKQIAFEQQQKKLQEERDRVKKQMEDQKKIKEENERQEKLKIEEEIKRLMEEQERIQKQHELEVQSRLQSQIEEQVGEIRQLGERITQRYLTINNKKIKLKEKELKLKKTNSKRNSRHDRLQRTSITIEEKGRSRSSTVSEDNTKRSRKSMPPSASITLEDVQQKKKKHSSSSRKSMIAPPPDRQAPPPPNNNNNNSNDNKMGGENVKGEEFKRRSGKRSSNIMERLVEAEEKYKRVERTVEQLTKRIMEYRSSILSLVSKQNMEIEMYVSLIAQFFLFLSENKLEEKKAQYQFQEFEKITDDVIGPPPDYPAPAPPSSHPLQAEKKGEEEIKVVGDEHQKAVDLSSSSSSSSEMMQKQRLLVEKQKSEEKFKVEIEQKEKAREAERQLREAQTLEIMKKIELEKQKLQERIVTQHAEAKEEVPQIDREQADHLEKMSREIEQQKVEIMNEQQKLVEIEKQQEIEREEKERQHQLQRERRRKAIEEARKRFEEQGDLALSAGPLKSGATVNKPQATSLSAEDLEKKLAIKRTNISREIYDTEKSYVESLRTLVYRFQKPLLQQAEIDGLTEDPTFLTFTQIRTIFGCVEVILNFNNLLLESLEQRLKTWYDKQRLGDVFITLTDYLRCYVQYVNNYNNAMTELSQAKANNTAFVKFVQKAERAKDCKNLSLESFLIMPIQRVPRYVLLLSDLLKNTPEDHPDHSDLSVALEKMKETGVVINERKREAESISKLYEVYSALGGKVADLIQPSRRFIHEGGCKFAKKENTKMKKGYLHLFNDIIILSIPHRHNVSFEYKAKVYLLQIHLAGLDDTKKMKNALKMIGSSSSDSDKNTSVELVIGFKDSSEKDLWSNHILAQNDDVLSRRYSFTRNSFRGRPVF